MNPISTILKGLRRTLIGVLAIGLLFVSTACSQAPNTRMPNNMSRAGEPNPPGQIQSYEGGMNNFRDIDTTRLDPAPADAKAKALKDRVERNLRQKRADSVDQYVENYRTGTPLNERVENIGKDIQRGTENLGEDASNLGDRLSDKAGRATDRAADRTSQAAQNIRDNTRDAGRDLVRDTKKAAERATDAAERAADRAVNNNA